MLYDLIKTRVQILDVIGAKVELKKRGADYIGLCPFHGEKTPSFTVNNAKGVFYCFGCHVGGDVIGFVSQISGMSYRDSAIDLARQHSIELPNLGAAKAQLEEFEQLYLVMEMAWEFYRKNLNSSASSYLKSRGINLGIIEKFQLGFAPGGNSLRKFLESRKVSLLLLDRCGLIAGKEGNHYDVFRDRIIFPIRNNYGKLIAFGGRALASEIQPKYLNSPETVIFKKSEHFYGENFAYNHCYKTSKAILVEGYMDLIKMHSAGFNNTLATLGTAVNERHLDKLWAVVDEIIMCLDGDAAGMRASKKVIDMALPKLSANKIITFVKMPAGMDPDDVLSDKDAYYMENLIDNRLELSKMIWQFETNGQSFTSAEAKARLESKLSSYVALIVDPIVAKNYRSFFHDQLWWIGKSRQKKGVLNVVSLPSAEHDMTELTLIALLMRYPELFVDEEIVARIKLIKFSSQYGEFINAGQINCLENNVVPIIKKNNPGFFASLSKTDPKKVFLKILKQRNLILLKSSYKELARSDPKKFLENYNTYKIEIDQLKKDDE
jgi:DNA primase